MHYNCLIVDDEKDLAQMTCEYFELYDVSCAFVITAAACADFIQSNDVDILLLDINLKEESGFRLCKKIRESSTIPILFVSARQSEEDMLTALSIGGDDYIRKPYTLRILLAKIQAMLKRMSYLNESKEQNQKNDMEKHDRMYLDEGKLQVTIDGRDVSLKAKEFRLLQCLYDHKNTIVTKEKLFDEVWGDAFFSDGTLNVHIRRLREKLEKNPNEPELIKTIWGTG